jgi:hypothetical protein
VIATTRIVQLGALGSVLLGAACLGSSSPALPPVRWFDPLPEPAAAGRDGPQEAATVRVTALPHLGKELAVRVGAREFAFDAGNQWLLEPAQAVAIVAGRALAGAVDPRTVELRVDAFELDVTAEPRAYVRVAVGGAGQAGLRVLEARADSRDRSPASFAAAMATALADLQQQLHGAFATAPR